MKFKVWFITAVLILLIGASYVQAAEGISSPLSNPPTVSISKETGGASKISFQEKVLKESSLKRKTSAYGSDTGASEKNQATSFKNLVFRMLKALLGVLLLIAALVGGILFYKWIKTKKITPMIQKHISRPEEEIREPVTISEAVSSFVKHRLKK